MILRSALYSGRVFHKRFRPRTHRLDYRVFWLLLDLDEIETLGRRLRLFSHNRFNLFGVHDRDHGNGGHGTLRAHVESQLREAGIDPAGGSIQLLCMPRVLGYVFNPLSIYFCRRADGRLVALLYEVTNTFGERHSYLIPVEATETDKIRQQCRKSFYVSPFMDMEMTYDFTVSDPADTLSVVVRTTDAQGPMLTAAMSGDRLALTDANILRLLATNPLLTFKVVAGIHLEALRLWRKGIVLRKRPAAPDSPVTILRKT